MKKTSHREAEARRVYDRYWASYHKGDEVTFASTLDDTFEMIGTSETEICHTKADGIAFLQAQVTELAGKAEMRNRQINVVPVDQLMLVNEQCDVYVLTDSNWHYYSKIRLSTLLRETEAGWKVIQQHGSLPDMRVQEGETLAIDKINKENIELRDAVKRRTAELQNKNRELEIEAALERVRAKVMGMTNSNELNEISFIFGDQLRQLGIDWVFSYFWLIEEDKGSNTFWITWPDKKSSVTTYPMDDPGPLLTECLASWRRGDQFHSNHLPPEHIGDFLESFEQLISDAGSSAEQIMHRDNFPHGLYYYDAMMRYGSFGLCMNKAATEEANQIQCRFAVEFERAYMRFLELQKAEAQAREAQIEAALERVRSRTMAMQKSTELREVIQVVYDQFVLLNIRIDHTGFVMDNNSEDDYHIWIADRVASPSQVTIPYFDCVYYNQFNEAKEKGLDFFATNLTFEEKNKFYQDLFNHVPGLPEEALEFLLTCPGLALSTVLLEDVCLYIENFSGIPYTDEENHTLMRFGNVFQQTYTRFHDLKKAEAQTREAQIEASLERVRSKAMAMHTSEDLNPAVATVFAELEKLSPGMSRCGIGIIDRDKRTANAWITSITDEGATVQISGDEPMDSHPLLQGVFEAWLVQQDFSYVLKGKDMTRYYETSGSGNVRLPDSQLILAEDKSKQQYYHIAMFQDGGVFAFRDTEFPEEVKVVMKRFAGVFNLTYQRFLDLQRAETQARDATIEAALEKVRGKAMAMNDTKDLSSTIVLAFAELNKLGITALRFGVGLINKETRKAQLYSAAPANDGAGVALMGWILFHGHPVFEQIYDSWIKNEEYFPVLEGEQLKSYYELLLAGLNVPKLPDWKSGEKQYGHFFPLPVSCLYAWTEQPYSETDKKILRRFASIIELTFKRYLELQQSEASTRDAIRQASLDRVRAETASMRTPSDLEKITPLIWNELTTLGVPFTRCGVFIMDDTQQQIHTFLSTPDGKAIAAFHLPYETHGTTTHVLAHWRRKEMYQDHWDTTAFKEWTKILLEQGAIAASEKYLTENQPTNLHLHFLPFLQGMLYTGSETPLNAEELFSVQNLADAFSTAYARYEDFNRLETAKGQVEKTLVDLKQAQAQLVQSEKMASLGELTAGIAHEIQNPLNFVNNFSEVSNELIEEMHAELDKGDVAEAKAIASDIRQNLEKINHHGKRADAIVKGMLQHSRTSSGTKEPTDINMLADEYLRLAYHGLRAKDKSFNASMKTDFDETIGHINVIPQDIGRVILNLITNAFYACSHKAKQTSVPGPQYTAKSQSISVKASANDSAKGDRRTANSDYIPTVTVTTKNLGDKIEIRVKDNGMGIPEHIKDKIFQPFFTTKPTGQGTGLGLSLSYDIVKAHGGEISLHSKEGEGTEFVIVLPLTNKN